MSDLTIAAPPRPGPEKRLGFTEKLSYGLGDLSASLAWNTASAFALIFYTDIALLPAAAIGFLLFFTRIFDAILDLFLGFAVDRTRTRWGRARPYLLYAAVPIGILTAFTFYVPDLSENMRLFYAWITYFLLGLFVSIANIPYSALMPLMTSDFKEKLDLSAARSIATSIGVIAVTAGFMHMVGWLGRGDQEQGYFLTATIIGATATIMLLLCFMNCRERNVLGSERLEGIWVSLRHLFSNQAWLTVSTFAFANFIRFGGILALTPLFAIYVLGKPWMISILMPALSGTLLLAAFFAPPILKRLGMRTGCILSLIGAAICYIILPFTETQPWLFIGIYILSSLIISVTLTATYAMASDAVDYHEWTTGVRHEGLLSAGVAFAIKVGMALGGSFIAFGLAFGGYNPENVTEQAKDVMSWMYYGIPLVAFALQLFIIRFYPVDALRGQIDAELKARRA